MLAAMNAVDAARVERDEAYRARYEELQAEGLGYRAALKQMREELEATFTAEELKRIGVSETGIMNAVRRGPLR
jgi:hypothetical protein